MSEDITIFFLTKIQALVNFLSLIGNDLETREILYFTSFCSDCKERFGFCKCANKIKISIHPSEVLS